MKPTPMKFKRKQLVRHLKTRTIYRIIHTPAICRLESTGEPAYAYQLINNPHARLWVRSQAEMEDGRFEGIPS